MIGMRMVCCAALFTVPALLALKPASPPMADGTPRRIPSRTTVQERPLVDVAFLLDTTGSMGGLIAGAKQKIWTIANRIVSGKPTPQVRIGLVGYRDRGDEYVTRVHDLTDDIDGVYANLQKFQAAGGGDTPEHVNQALRDAFDKLSWSKDPKALKIIFLVGDAPPHDDYHDGMNSLELAKEAAQRGIKINTIRCGSAPDTELAWRAIASLADGDYSSIAQDGAVATVSTPMDAELAHLNAALSGTTVAFGRPEAQIAASSRASASAALAPSVAAERASFATKASARATYGESDLLAAVADGRADIKSLKSEELPEIMQSMSVESRQQFVTEMSRKRASLTDRIAAVSQHRAAYIDQQRKSNGASTDSFDDHITRTIAKQARAAGVTYE